MNERSVKRKFK